MEKIKTVSTINFGTGGLERLNQLARVNETNHSEVIRTLLHNQPIKKIKNCRTNKELQFIKYNRNAAVTK